MDIESQNLVLSLIITIKSQALLKKHTLLQKSPLWNLYYILRKKTYLVSSEPSLEPLNLLVHKSSDSGVHLFRFIELIKKFSVNTCCYTGTGGDDNCHEKECVEWFPFQTSQ